MTPPARVHSLLWLDPLHLSARDKATLQEQLTYHPKEYDVGGKGQAVTPAPLKGYTEDYAGHVGVPLSFGLRVCKARNIPLQDDTTEGEAIVVPRTPTSREDITGQAEFFADTLTALRERRVIMVQAATGKGKTVAGCFCIGALQRATIVVVPTSAVMTQWVDELVKHNGFPPDRIGVVGDGSCSWEECDVVVMLLNSAAEKEMPDEFFTKFGLVIMDEAHRLGARMFSKSMHRFPARYRMAMTATPDRKDGCMGMVTDAFGKPRVVCGGDALLCHVRTLHYRRRFWNRPPSALPSAVLTNLLAKDNERNAMLARRIALLYADSRHIMGLGDRLEQLDLIKELLCNEHDLPADTVGIFTASTSKLERARIRRDCRVILGTYALLKEAVDIPRLDAGIELTPRADAIQAIGRVRRPHAGKRTPVWVTVRDAGVSMLEAFHSKRLRDFKATNCIIHE